MKYQEWRWVLLVTLALVAASSLPYLAAWALTPEDAHFTGLIFNPQDGHSYIAKMRQGLEGSWLFHLAFTPERHPGAYLFLFHLLLGHLARWLGLPLIVVYHSTRVLGGAAMLLALYGLASRIDGGACQRFSTLQGRRRVMFLLAALGAGLGWLMGPVGVVTSDLWVPEAFPAYALLANAHFPLTIGLMVGIALCGLEIMDGSRQQDGGSGKPGSRKRPWGLGMIVGATALGVIQPFGLVAVFGGLGTMLMMRTMRERAIPWQAVAWVVGAGAVASPYPVYMQWAIRSDPVLAAWNAQNLTASPPLWDWMLSYGLVLVLAVLGAIVAARRGSDGDWLLLGWTIVTFVGMYLPLPLQRRISLGLGVPMGMLAGMGWWRVMRPRVRVPRQRLTQRLVVAFCALTPVFLVLMALLAGRPWFYLSGGEWAALEWLRREGQPDAVVLSAPQTGTFIPAWAGQSVVYGHPFETVEADRRKAQVEAYWAGEMSPTEREAFLRENDVKYILVGPRELELGGGRFEIGGEPEFEAGGVSVYQVNGCQDSESKRQGVEPAQS